MKEILATRTSTCTIICDELRKVYQGKDGVTANYAVRGLSIAVPRGQCFGMLGPNGAGKTSSINMVRIRIKLSIRNMPLFCIGTICIHALTGDLVCFFLLIHRLAMVEVSADDWVIETLFRNSIYTRAGY